MLLRFCISILLFTSSIFFVIAQDLENKFQEALKDPPSAPVFFEEIQQEIQTKADSGLYFFYEALYQLRQDKRKEAVQTFLKSVGLLDIHTQPLLYISAYNNLTYLESILGDWEKAMLYGQKALESSRIANDSNKMGYSMADIAIVYHDMEQYDKGVEFSKKGYEILEAYSKANPKTKAFALNAIAINFDDWEKPDSALFYHYKVFDLYPELDSADFTNTFNNIGNTLLKQEKYKEAKKWVEISLKYNYLAGDKYKIATNYNNLATIAYNLNDFYSAELLMDSTYKYVVASESREKLRDYLFDQFRFQRKKGDLNQAIDYLEQYAALKDSIFKEDRIRMIGEIQTLYEVEAKERELAESRAALVENELIVKNRNNQLLLLLISLLLILGLSFFVYYRQKNKTYQLEQEAKLQSIYAEQLTQKRLQEQRSRISSDLHDNIGAQLTFIISFLNNLKFGDLTKEKLGAKIDQISAFTVETISELRDTIWAMNKDSIGVEDLKVRLAALIIKAKEACPTIDFSLDVEKNLSQDTQLGSLEGVNYFRIAQEALNNAIKHSGASKIEIFIGQKGENQISISVIDNGCGIPENKILGSGLNNMRVRAERIGKELKIESKPGEKTLIMVA
jgi:signal transduction histidine kinase